MCYNTNRHRWSDLPTYSFLVYRAGRGRNVVPEREYQTCYDCKKILPLCRFCNGSMSPQGNRVYCDACTTIRDKKQAFAERKKRERKREQAKKRYHENREEFREKNRLNRLKHLEKRRRYDKISYQFRKKKKSNYQRKFGRRYPNRKDQNDPVCNFYQRISCGLWGALNKRGFIKNNISTVEVLGASPQDAWGRLTATYKVNYGEEWAGQPYHIDHIRPLSTAKTKRDVLRLYHYSNLQMLSPEDNKRKSDGLEWESPYQRLLREV